MSDTPKPLTAAEPLSAIRLLGLSDWYQRGDMDAEDLMNVLEDDSSRMADLESRLASAEARLVSVERLRTEWIGAAHEINRPNGGYSDASKRAASAYLDCAADLEKALASNPKPTSP